MTKPLPFCAPFLLAPMEGVTEPCFRDLVLECNPPDRLGGAFTEFVRVIDRSRNSKYLRAHLGPNRFPQAVGLQLMGRDPGAVAHTAALAAEKTDVPLIDLNFGCPAKGALRGCAGAALLDDPAAVEELVRTVVNAVPHLPISAKIRAGGEDDSLLEDLARAVEAGGAALLTVHCRTRREAYGDTADWGRLRRAVQSVSIPVCGNGGIESSRDLELLGPSTGCALAMVGRAALADPWIFSARAVSTRTAATFLVRYAEELWLRYGAGLGGRAARVKQLLSYWTAGDLVPSPAHRKTWLRTSDPLQLLGRLEGLADLPGRATGTGKPPAGRRATLSA